MDKYRSRAREDSRLAPRPPEVGLLYRPRPLPDESFQSFLQAITGDQPREPRSFGGQRNHYRCECAASDLLFLLCDGSSPLDEDALIERILEGASRFGYSVRVDRIERREVTGCDVFAIRETNGKAFSTLRLPPRPAS